MDGFAKSIDWKRKLRTGGVLGFLILFAVLFRLTWLSASHHTQALRAWSGGQSREAVDAYTWSIRNYYPGNPYAGSAAGGLRSIADFYRARNERTEEQQVLEDLRASLLSIRSFYQPYATILADVDQRLQELTPSKP